MNTRTVYESNLAGLELLNRGKVRDIYQVDDDHLLFLASDRLSAFDVVLPDPIPGKGVLLNSLSNFWFNKTGQVVKNHLSDLTLDSLNMVEDDLQQALGRSVIVKKVKPLPVEAIVRGYVIGSGWKDYQATGSISGVELPAGLEQAAKLPEPIFTPSTKAAVGDHDENINYADTVGLVGAELASQIRDLSIRIYTLGVEYAAERGIIIADTKFEFGLDADGILYLIDEVLTPDSSRFWPMTEYHTGISPPSFDKQYVRDYLETLDWDKRAPGPKLPQEVINNTVAKYREACTRLTENQDSG